MCKQSCLINRIFSCLLILSLVFSTVNTANKKIVKAAETEDYIEISNISELYAIRNNLEGKYILTKDIDLSEATAPGGELDVGNGWVPIDGFRGTLDGNGHYIKGLTMYGEVNQDYVGLFGNAYSPSSNFTVCNLGLVDVNINITMPKEKTYQSSDWYVGGIVGNGKGAKISSCFVTGNITIQSESSDGCVGGLAGTEVYLKECYNAANVNVYKEDGKTYRDLYVGGLCGISIYGSDTMLYNCGTINGGSGGAIAGGNGTGGHDDSGNNFYLQGTGMGQSATPHTETQMKNKNYFSKWDFMDVWEIDACSNYSYPQLRTCMQKRVKKMEIVNMPSKLEYEQGDEIDFSDGTVKLEYEDGYDVTIYITEDMIKNTYDTFLLGKQQIGIYKGLANTAIEITVNEIPVKEIKLNAKSITLKKGYSTQINATVLPERATYQEVSWSSADETIASVDQTGKVTGKGKGTTTITATAQNGVSVSCRVEVTIPCVSLRVESEDIEIEKGGSYVPNYTLSPLDCTDHVSWKSEDEDVLHIDNDGNWLGIQGGKTAVIGTADSGVTAICNVTVLQDLSEFSVLNIEDKTYTGNLITQDIKVTDGTKTLVENTDYKVRYNANVKVGEASITITGVKPYQGEITRKFNIVPPEEDPTTPVHDLKLDKEKIQIKKGYKEKLSATVLPAEATDKTISWSSQDETVATVDAAGNVTGKGSGTTTITASSKEGVSATCQVTVTVPSLTISLDSYDVTIGKGDAYSPNYKMSPLDSTDTVMWKSSDENIVHIDDEGNWIGISGGKATIKGTTDSGVTTICNVTVVQKLSDFSVQNIEDKTYTGKLITQNIVVTDGTKTLVENTDYKVKYTANLNVGEATITITGEKLYRGEIVKKFNIVPPEEEPTIPVYDLKMDKEKIQVKKGYKEQLSVTVLPAEATDKTILWSSQDETVATVDAAGNVTGKRSGTTTITASSKEGVTATCQVTVIIPCLTFFLDSYDITIERGDVYKPICRISPLDFTDTIVWESSDESIVHIDDEGNWIGISGGTVTVNGRTESGQKVSCKVTVRIPCVHIQLDSSELTLNKGESYKPVFQTTPVDTTDHITWSSSDEKVLHIDSEGNWIGKSGGTATVLAKTEDGIGAECKVTVLQNIAEFDVLCVEDKEYTGDVILQDVKVTDGNKTLVKDTDYTVTYSSNIHVGEALITITGKRPYLGSVEKKFFIKSNNKETESNKPNETNKVEVSLETNKDAAVNPTNPEKTQTNKVKLSKGQITSIKASKKKLTICWKKVENAVGYQLQVAKDKKFTKGKKNYYLNSATLKKVFKGARKTNYYVRVRAYAYDTEGQTFNGSYSSTKKKKTK